MGLSRSLPTHTASSPRGEDSHSGGEVPDLRELPEQAPKSPRKMTPLDTVPTVATRWQDRKAAVREIHHLDTHPERGFGLDHRWFSVPRVALTLRQPVLVSVSEHSDYNC